MKIYSLFLPFFFVLATGMVFAQESQGQPTSRQLVTHEPGDRSQSIYFEILGPGITYSFSYDSRFQDTLNGLGARGGVGYIAVDGNSVFTAPFMLNYLLGKEGKYMEMGIGASYISFNSSESADERGVMFIDESQLFGTMVFGYRSQPVDGGFMFRTGMAPLFGRGNFIPFWIYLSFGYSF